MKKLNYLEQYIYLEIFKAYSLFAFVDHFSFRITTASLETYGNRRFVQYSKGYHHLHTTYFVMKNCFYLSAGKLCRAVLLHRRYSYEELFFFHRQRFTKISSSELYCQNSVHMRNVGLKFSTITTIYQKSI